MLSTLSTRHSFVIMSYTGLMALIAGDDVAKTMFNVIFVSSTLSLFVYLIKFPMNNSYSYEGEQLVHG